MLKASGMRKASSVAVGLVTFSALCLSASLSISRPLTSSGTRSRATYASVVNGKTLGVTLAYLEHQVGPAKFQQGALKTYEIAGCEVLVAVHANRVSAIGVDRLSSKCPMNLGSFLPNDARNLPARPTIGKLAAVIAPVTLVTRCLGPCGNMEEGYASLLGSSSHADGFLEIRADFYVGEPRVDDRWKAAYVRKFGGDGEPRCGFRDVNDIALRGYDATQPFRMMVGSNVSDDYVVGEMAKGCKM